jgi:hypothetical protein
MSRLYKLLPVVFFVLTYSLHVYAGPVTLARGEGMRGGGMRGGEGMRGHEMQGEHHDFNQGEHRDFNHGEHHDYNNAEFNRNRETRNLNRDVGAWGSDQGGGGTVIYENNGDSDDSDDGDDGDDGFVETNY